MTTATHRAPTRGTESAGAGAGLAAYAVGPDSRESGVREAPAPAASKGDLGEVAAATLAAARDHLLGLQDPRGWWIGELETNVTMDAEDLLLRHFLGILTDTDLKETAAWIRSQQRADGTWANFYGGPGDLSTTVEAYVALRLAGEPGRRRSHACRGGLDHRAAAASPRPGSSPGCGWRCPALWDWDALPVIPPEVIYLPSWFPLNIYDWGCWARQTIVALAVVSAHQPSKPLPFDIDELYATVPGLPPKGGQRDPVVAGVQRARQGAARDRAAYAEAGPPRRVAPLHRVDHRPPGGRRLLGRHPAAMGVLHHGTAPDGLRPGQPRRRPGHLRPGAVHHPRGRPAPPGGVPVAGLGHRALHDRAGGRRARAGPPRPGQRRPLGAGRGDPPAGRLAGPPAAHRPRLAGRSSSTTTTTPTPTTPPRSCSRCAG